MEVLGLGLDDCTVVPLEKCLVQRIGGDHLFQRPRGHGDSFKNILTFHEFMLHGVAILGLSRPYSQGRACNVTFRAMPQSSWWETGWGPPAVRLWC